MKVIKVFETDWLATEPVFYNEKTGKVSRDINEVIDFEDIEFHPEGFNNYLDFGYSVFEQTPIKNVKFLRYSSRLKVFEDGSLEVEYLSDPVENMSEETISEEQVLEMIRLEMYKWESSVIGNIVVPTSGGFDSRLLNYLVTDKTRIESYSYGISNNQSESYEVVRARELAKKLGTKWQQIELGNYHQYFNEWDNLFGISTHAHGMYHIEFYNKIRKFTDAKYLLSGIIGDAWSGNVKFKKVSSDNLSVLGYTHGINADSRYSLLNKDTYLKGKYYNDNKEKFSNDKLLVIESMRIKMILLSYLLKIPKYFGFEVWSPFLIPQIVIAMLNISKERKNGRQWQVDFFKKNGIYFEDDKKIKVDFENTLDYQAIIKNKPEPLRIDLLKEVINFRYLEYINKRITILEPSILEKFIDYILHIPKLGGLLRLLGCYGFKDSILKAYNAYLILKPIENILKKRIQ